MKKSRLIFAAKASAIHLIFCVVIAIAAACLVFGLWYPFPYNEISGGRELFILIITVDVICGPLITMVVFNPHKPNSELRRDIALVALIQVAALIYGVHTVWQARPVFLVHEIDRFKVITLPALDMTAVNALPENLKISWHRGPQLISTRAPINDEERQKVLFESMMGGRDYGERPEFYIPYNNAKSLEKAKPLSIFLEKDSWRADDIRKKILELNIHEENLFYIPIISRAEWIAIVDSKGEIRHFSPGSGF